MYYRPLAVYIYIYNSRLLYENVSVVISDMCIYQMTMIFDIQWNIIVQLQCVYIYMLKCYSNFVQD
jgi:hypothetical protein